FVTVLEALRLASVDASAAAFIRALERPLPADIVRPARLYPLRASVEKANTAELKRLPGPSHAYHAVDTGPAKNFSILLDSSPAMPLLTLKVGAQVMLLKNYDDGLANGTLGSVEGFSTLASYQRQYSPIEEEENQPPVLCTQQASPAPAIEPDIIGRPFNGRNSTESFPVVAFLITASSGLQAVRRVLVMRDDFKIDGADGQVYVAISRAQSVETLQVIGFHASKVRAHPAVVEWSQSLQTPADASGLYRLTAEATDWQQQQVADRIMDSGDPCSPSVVVAYLTDHDIVPDLFLMLGWDPYIQRAHVLDKTGKVHMLRPHCIIGELGDKEQAKGLAGIQ
ncbi:hypothetical protein GGG16DRAFT_107008, partial [Schizophyllum commune]